MVLYFKKSTRYFCFCYLLSARPKRDVHFRLFTQTIVPFWSYYGWPSFSSSCSQVALTGRFLYFPLLILLNRPTSKKKQQLPLLSLLFTSENYPVYFTDKWFFLSFNKGTFSLERIKNASWEYNNLLCNAERIVSSCVIKTFQVIFLSDEHTNTSALPDGVHYICLNHFIVHVEQEGLRGTKRIAHRLYEYYIFIRGIVLSLLRVHRLW